MKPEVLPPEFRVAIGKTPELKLRHLPLVFIFAGGVAALLSIVVVIEAAVSIALVLLIVFVLLIFISTLFLAVLAHQRSRRSR